MRSQQERLAKLNSELSSWKAVWPPLNELVDFTRLPCSQLITPEKFPGTGSLARCNINGTTVEFIGKLQFSSIDVSRIDEPNWLYCSQLVVPK